MTTKTNKIAEQDSFIDMHLQEIEQRAWMMHNLKHSKADAMARIKQNLAWEFDFVALPAKLEKKIEEIVARIYEK
jgi:hypothetical protein